MKKFILAIIFFCTLVFPRDCFRVHQNLDRTVSYLDEFKISESGWFKVHYNVEGAGSASIAYVDEVLYIADSIRSVLKNTMGYQDPPLANNDDPFYHIFLKSNYDYPNYGATYTGTFLFEELLPSGSSFIEIDHNYENYTVYNGLDPIITMRETLAHEYFHAVQLSYRTFTISEKYFFELSSMWFEDLVVPDGNDWSLDIWTDALISNPEYPLEWNSSFSVNSADWGYSLALFGHYLSKVVDDKGLNDEKQSTIMREMWELYSSNSAYDAFDAMRIVSYDNYGQSMHSIWLDFMTRNMFNSIEGSEFHYFEDQNLVDPLEIELDTFTNDVEFEINLNNKAVKIVGFNFPNNSLLDLKHSSNNFIGNIVNLENEGTLLNAENEMNLLINANQNLFLIYSTEDVNAVSVDLSLTFNSISNTPSNIFLFQNSNEEIEVSWDLNYGVQENVLFNVYRNDIKINEEGISGSVFKDISFEPLTAYTYYVTSFNQFGESHPSDPVFITSWPGIDDVDSKITVYPNPVQNNLNLLLDSRQKYGREIGYVYNSIGQRVSFFSIDIAKGRQRCDIKNALLGLSSGRYFIVFKNKNIPGASFLILK